MSSALDVLCPACNTPPGMRCRTLATRRSTDTHKARRDSYRAGDVTIPTRWAKDDGREIAWMTFSKTHTRTDTCDQGCVIHNRTDHHMKHWLLIWRDDRGIFERLCPEHGCGHPDPNQGPYWAATGQDWQWIHGCCGCCVNVKRGKNESLKKWMDRE